ncbi:NADH dehydrogenase 1 alpha subcomplex assembly factor 3 [Thelonectria olida]|uniref:Mth938 domain-containing protein n=1 Tax=Thelonectria olida TaxID=1576542 RepID=A0A9P8WDD1_9HYPO|nr:NADH dehydrogenase 1 alpha subcomplex assembly factor 3 [Thelonectria olida]
MSSEQSPKIASIAWGHMEIAGLEPGKDFKLYPGGGRSWDWGETGMRHNPGIRVVDVEELLQKGATTIVLSQGMDLKLQIDPATLSYLEGKGVAVHVAETRKAVEIYNSLAGTAAVGGLFHSTC